MSAPQTRYVGFGDYQVEVCADAPELLAGVEHRFCHMLVPTVSRSAGHLRVLRHGERYRLMRDGQPRATSVPLAQTLHLLHDEILLHLVRATPHLVWLHAGAVARQERALVIAGPSGAGKSTLVTTLYRRGWRYLGDDLLPLESGAGLVHPFPQTPGVRRSGDRIIPSKKLHQLKKMAIELDPARIAQTAMPVQAILLPAFRPETEAWLEPVGPAETAAALLENCVNFILHREAAVETLCRLVEARPAFRLPYSDAEQAADVVETLGRQ